MLKELIIVFLSFQMPMPINCHVWVEDKENGTLTVHKYHASNVITGVFDEVSRDHSHVYLCRDMGTHLDPKYNAGSIFFSKKTLMIFWAC